MLITNSTAFSCASEPRSCSYPPSCLSRRLTSADPAPALGEVALGFVRGAADLRVHFHVGHVQLLGLRDRLEDQPAFHALDGLGEKVVAHFLPVDLRLLDVDALRGKEARVVLHRLA